MHQLDRVARSYRHVAELRAAHDRAVVLDDDDARIELQRAEQLEQGGASRHRAPLAVHRDVDRVVHPRSSCSMRRAAPAGSAASHKARIAAAPYAPAARSPGIRSGITPPMAMTGSPSATITARSSGASGAPSRCLAGAYTGPRAARAGGTA